MSTKLTRRKFISAGAFAAASAAVAACAPAATPAPTAAPKARGDTGSSGNCRSGNQGAGRADCRGR